MKTREEITKEIISNIQDSMGEMIYVAYRTEDVKEAMYILKMLKIYQDTIVGLKNSLQA